jgi:hypothetical protein
MSRKLLAATVSIGALLMFAVPALAITHHSSHVLRMGGKVGRAHRGGASIAKVMTTGVVDEQGFSCQVVIGTGSNDQTYIQKRTRDSVEYSVTKNGSTAVTTVCIGKVPAGTTVASHAVSAPTTNCGQDDPNRPGKFISGGGVITTFKDGLYLSACTTPDYH